MIFLAGGEFLRSLQDQGEGPVVPRPLGGNRPDQRIAVVETLLDVLIRGEPQHEFAPADEVGRGVAAAGVVVDVLVQGLDEFPALGVPVERQEGEPHHVGGPRTQRRGHDDLALPLRIEEVLPALGHGQARLGQPVLVADQDEGEVADVVPVALRVHEHIRDPLPGRGDVGNGPAVLLGQEARGRSAADDHVRVEIGGFGLHPGLDLPEGLEGLIDGDARLVLDELGDLGVVVRRGAHIGVDLFGHGAAGKGHAEDRGDNDCNELSFHNVPPFNVSA